MLDTPTRYVKAELEGAGNGSGKLGGIHHKPLQQEKQLASLFKTG